ncbi:MAG: response regulator [Nitrospinota bacterium]
MAAPTILFIDDEEDLRTIVRMSLESIGGYEVYLAASGEEGLEIAAREQPDAILMDVMMPGLDGPATLERLRRDERCAQIPVIFLTAKSRPAEVQRLKDLGALEVLTKPFYPMGLPHQVRRILERVSPNRPDELTILDLEGRYLRGLAGRIEELRNVLRSIEAEPDDLAVTAALWDLRHTFFNLAGSGATHGFTAISAVARAAEQCVAGYLNMGGKVPEEARSQIAAYIDELDQYREQEI